MQETIYIKIVCGLAMVLGLLILFWVAILIDNNIIASYQQIVQDFHTGKWYRINKRIDKYKKLFKPFMYLPWNNRIRYMFNNLCWYKALVVLQKDEDVFFRSLEDIKKKEEYSSDIFIKAIFYLNKEDRIKAEKYYKEYLLVEKPDPNMKIILECLFSQSQFLDTGKLCIWAVKNLRNPVIENLINGIYRVDDIIDTDVFENMKKDGDTGLVRIVLSVMVMTFLAISSIRIPWGELLFVFPSWEEAYDYKYTKSQVLAALEGNTSVLVIEEEDDEHIENIIQKSENGWKLGLGMEIRSTMELIEGTSVTRYQYKEDYYIIVNPLRSDVFSVYDSCNSAYELITFSKGEKEYFYCAYIQDYDEDYWININGARIKM